MATKTKRQKFKRLPKGPNGGIQLLLIQSVDHLGKQGEVVEVKTGFANNYLIPQGLATLATDHHKRMVDKHRVRLLESTRIGSLEQAIKLICQRLDLIDGEGKRLDLLEDRIEDIDGTDGDIVDLIERMHSVETVAPQLFDYLADENPAMELEALEARVLNLERDNLLQPSRTQPVQELSEA